MKLQNTVGEVIVANTGSVSNFKINASAKSFSILSNSLYQNKIRAIIRELSCNALDSHVAAGTNRQFEIHLPTAIDPYFSVTDYGTGMTPEQIVSVYTTYFESTKTDSDNFIGALGLGSKSPFSYTDAMVITSNCNGISTVYSAFIDSSGIPSITQLNQSDTTECNGLSIQFAVKEGDFGLFQYECDAVFQWWKSEDLPIIHNLSSPFKNIRELSVEVMSGVKTLPSYTQHVSYRTSVAVMGNIAYPIDSTHFDKKYLDILTSELLIEFPIGALDFQPSREGLSYINYTKHNITQKLQEILDYTHQHIKNTVDALDNVWDRNAKIVQFYNKKLYASAAIEYAKAHDNHDVKHNIYGLTVKNIEFSYTMTEFNIQITPLKRTGYARIIHNLILRSDYSYIFIVNEKCIRGAKTRSLAKWKEDREDKFILEPIDATKPFDLAGLKAYFNNPPESMFINVDDLPKPVKTYRPSVKKSPTSINVQRYTSYNSTDATVIDLDSTNTYYYLNCTGPHWDSKRSGQIRDVRLVRIAKECCALSDDVYKINKVQYTQIKNKSNWIDLEVYLEEHVSRLESQLHRFCMYVLGDSIQTIQYDSIKSRIHKFDEFDAKWGSLFNWHKADYSEKVLTLITIFGSEELNAKRIDTIAAVRALLNEFYVKYPMLRYVSSNSNNSKSIGDDIVNYINLVDQKI